MLVWRSFHHWNFWWGSISIFRNVEEWRQVVLDSVLARQLSGAR
jgi:hypothetical protein